MQKASTDFAQTIRNFLQEVLGIIRHSTRSEVELSVVDEGHSLFDHLFLCRSEQIDRGRTSNLSTKYFLKDCLKDCFNYWFKDYCGADEMFFKV